MSIQNKEYDVYYSTGGGSLVGGGADALIVPLLTMTKIFSDYKYEMQKPRYNHVNNGLTGTGLVSKFFLNLFLRYKTTYQLNEKIST